ncbi:MAG TPA: M48 family metallopeptidase [Kofleriaceae bacterium]|nr:M48 family metallopeptidase [Kofleriaceae bacterium]
MAGQTGIDFDFARYIAHRRGVVHQRARDGAAYAYVGEHKVRRALVTARPVSMAIEATTRLWKNAARNELLGTSVKVTDQQFPRAYAALRQACKALHLEVPPLYAAPSSSRIGAQPLGTDDDSYLVINAGLLDRLSDIELLAVIGNELGHIQNNHVVYATALHYLSNDSVMFVRWIVQPAIIALQAWSRRAEITCDRAALLCTRDLHSTLTAMVKLSIGSEHDINIDEYLRDLPTTRKGIGRYAELFRAHPYLPKRVQALQVFAKSSFYKIFIGEDPEGSLSADATDAQVAEILKVF